MAKTKRIDYEISDYKALEAAYPTLVSEETVHRVIRSKGAIVSDETVTRTFVAKEDKEKLYRLIKINLEMGTETPGITIKSDAAEPVAEPASADGDGSEPAQAAEV